MKRVWVLLLLCAGACVTAPQPKPPPPESVLSYTFGVVNKQETWSALRARLDAANPQDGEQARHWIEILESVVKQNPKHPDFVEVQARLGVLRELSERRPPRHVRMQRSDGSTGFVDLDALKRLPHPVTRRTLYQHRNKLERLTASNPGHPRVQELEAVLEDIDARLALMRAKREVSRYGVYAATRMAKNAWMLKKPRAFVADMLVSKYRPASRSRREGRRMNDGTGTFNTLQGPGRPVMLTTLSFSTCSQLHGLVPGLRATWGLRCRKETLSAWVKLLVGRPLYMKQGTMDPKTVDLVLKGLYLPPEAPLAGVKAREVYAVYRPTVRMYLRLWKNMKTVGVGRLMKSFREEKLASTKTGMNMNEFYRNTSFPGLYKGVNDLDEWPLTDTFGFWLRRFDDGTEKVLIKHAKKALKVYDPPLYKEIFGR